MRHYGFQVENEIFWNGIFDGWEKVSLQLWSELCQRSQTIMDIGSNTGVYALLAKTIQPDANIFAFEPVERVFKKLLYNNEINDYDITCEQTAVSNYDGAAIIYDKDTAHTYSVTVNKDLSINQDDSIPVKINTIRLDTYIEQKKISKIDLLKIDVEAHEVEVLKGFRRYIKEFEPTFIIEVLSDEVAEGIQNLIADINYVYFTIDEKSGIKRVSQLSKSDYYNFLICKPEMADSLEIVRRFEASYKNHDSVLSEYN